MICEALASGLPVVGLDAPGTRDLVVDGRTGFLLGKPDASGTSEWNTTLSDFSSVAFEQAAVDYSHLLGRLVFDTSFRVSMSKRAVEEGAAGKSWSHAMQEMVACYREGIAISSPIPPSDTIHRLGPRLRTLRYALLVLFIITLLLGATYLAALHS